MSGFGPRGRGRWRWVVLTFSLVLMAGCEDKVSPPAYDPAPAPAPVPAPQFPVPVPPTPVITPVAQPPQAPQPDPVPNNDYPLTNGAALSYLQLGYAVAGALSGGREGLAQQVEETVYEDQRVSKERCEYEWDYQEKKNKRTCKYVDVYERRPVVRQSYRVSNGVPVRTFSNALGAINAITQAGAVNWRLAG